jgi:hypothetical protein
MRVVPAISEANRDAKFAPQIARELPDIRQRGDPKAKPVAAFWEEDSMRHSVGTSHLAASTGAQVGRHVTLRNLWFIFQQFRAVPGVAK